MTKDREIKADPQYSHPFRGQVIYTDQEFMTDEDLLALEEGLIRSNADINGVSSMIVNGKEVRFKYGEVTLNSNFESKSRRVKNEGQMNALRNELRVNDL